MDWVKMPFNSAGTPGRQTIVDMPTRKVAAGAPPMGL